MNLEETLLNLRDKHPWVLCIVSLALGVVGGLLTRTETSQKKEYIFLTETKVEYKYWGEVVEKTNWKTRIVERKVTQADGTVIEEKEQEAQGNSETSQKVSEYENVSQVQVQVIKETVTKLDRYTLGVSYELLPIGNVKLLPSIDVNSIYLTGGIRLANWPVWLNISTGDLGRSWSAGLSWSF